MPEWSPSAAMASMKRTGTAKALLSVSAPGVTPAANDAYADDIARTVNDVDAELAKDHPDRFGFLATLPLPAVDAAAREATRALDELGADGVILLAQHAHRAVRPTCECGGRQGTSASTALPAWRSCTNATPHSPARPPRTHPPPRPVHLSWT